MVRKLYFNVKIIGGEEDRLENSTHPKEEFFFFIVHMLIHWLSIRSKVKVSLYQFLLAILRNCSPFIWPGGIESTGQGTKTLLIQPYRGRMEGQGSP